MALRQFITESELKTETTISANVEAELLRPFIQDAAEEHLRPVLGDDLFDAVLDEIEGGTLSTENAALVAKIRSSAAWWVFYYSLPFLRGKVTNKGVTLKTSDDSQPMDERAFQSFRNEIQGHALRKTEAFRKWLKTNEADYPMWKDCNAGKNRPYFSGIVFG